MTAARMSIRRTALIGAVLVALGPISMALYTPAMPELVQAFDTSESMIKLSLSLFFGGFALSQLISGTLSDALGRRKVTIIFMMIYLIGSLMAALAPSVEILLAGRLVQGIGASAGMTVSRAIVRDQFAGNEAAGIMNLIGMLLAIGPAFAPTLGGFALGAFGWQSIFLLMVLFGAIACLVAALFMRETSVPDREKARLRPVIAAYREILSDPRFVFASLVIGGAVGALYTQATVLPFILIDRVGLTPSEFGAGMLMQSGSFFLGSLSVRQLMKVMPARRAVVPGLVMIGIASLCLALSLSLLSPSFLSVMAPAGLYAFAIAFVMPHMMTAAIAPYPHLAGTASALMGFIQMGSGLVGGVVCALIGMPVLAMGIVIPALGVISIVSYIFYLAALRRRPMAAPETSAALDDELLRQAAE